MNKQSLRALRQFSVIVIAASFGLTIAYVLDHFEVTAPMPVMAISLAIFFGIGAVFALTIYALLVFIGTRRLPTARRAETHRRYRPRIG